MTPLTALLILLFRLCSAFVLDGFIFEHNEQHAKLQLPTEYHFKGDITSMDFEIIRPFEIWYSAQQNKSRKDTYGGLVKWYYDGDNKTIYTIHPKISETVCESLPNEEKPENFLPSKNFTRSGETTYDSKRVDVWKYSKTFGRNLMLEAKLLVQRGTDNDIPLVYEEREINLWNGVVNSHSITRYYEFQEPNIDDLTYEEADNCDLDDSAEVMSSLKHLDTYVPSDVEEAFKRYKNRHNKEYDDKEQELRALMFKRNWRLVMEHNNSNMTYKLGLNKFSDRLPSELAHLTATRPKDPSAHTTLHPLLSTRQLKELEQLVDDVPERYDMRIEGFISEIKNQGDCGSCWAFSTVASVEGALAKSNGGRLLDLSEQSLVDCAWYGSNDGCNGGFLDDSFEYVRLYGIPTDMKYGTYLSEDGICKFENDSDVSRIKGFARVPPMSPEAMKAVLFNYGPIAGTINAMNDLKYYFNGVYNNPDCNKGRLNHAVTIVGYGSEGGTPYWIVKNSWGQDWGQDGYLYMSAEGNTCLILEEAYYPIV